MVAPADIRIESIVLGLRKFRRACVVGKGPTMDRHRHCPEDCLLIGINQAAVECETTLAFVTDLDVLTDQFLSSLDDAVLALPIYPHVNFAPRRGVDLPSLVDADPRLRGIALDGRLAAYRSDRWPSDWPGPGGPDWPRVRVRGFTAVAVLACLHAAGVREVYTAGVDGGAAYHPAFTKQGLTPLSNGQKSFDVQFREFDRLRKRGMKITKL